MIHNALHNRRILLGVCGGIAAYKSADLVRRLREAGAQVRVVMTQSATQFVTPLTFNALSGARVATGWRDTDQDGAMTHITLARWADAMLIAPATADFLAKMRAGLADDLLGGLYLAADVPVWVAPAMNQQMWSNSATQENCAELARRGIRFMGPAVGDQACGETGAGRMSEPDEIVSALAAFWSEGPLQALRVVVTAGPTHEPIDPVRYISNRSSGKMGYAVAQAAGAAGAQVTLISGPTRLTTPQGVTRIDVETAQQMFEAVERSLAECDIFIAAAAVADYRYGSPHPAKLKKSTQALTLNLVPTTDILAHVGRAGKVPYVVGFAAETQDLLKAARRKLDEKKLDLIAANHVGEPGVGFDSNENALTLLWRGGEMDLPRKTKVELANELIAVIAERYYEKNPVKSS